MDFIENFFGTILQICKHFIPVKTWTMYDEAHNSLDLNSKTK